MSTDIEIMAKAGSVVFWLLLTTPLTILMWLYLHKK